MGWEEAFEEGSHDGDTGACDREGGFEGGEDVCWNGGVGEVHDVDLEEADQTDGGDDDCCKSDGKHSHHSPFGSFGEL